MNQRGFTTPQIIIFVLVFAVVAGGYFALRAKPLTSQPDSIIDISSPKIGEVVSSPINITGTTKPGWTVFEAQAGNARLYDENGKEIGSAILRAVGEWMKPEVEFEGTLIFISMPETENGKLIFGANDPRGDGKSKTYEMPVRFENYSKETRKIDLYFYNETKDREIAEYMPCSRDAVLPVVREIPLTKTPIQDAINLLLKGGVSDEEKLSGFKTEFPLSGLKLTGANLNNGKLTLNFEDLENKSGGGSCRVGLLWAQISKTALQFPEVKEVEFNPETLFQP